MRGRAGLLPARRGDRALPRARRRETVVDGDPGGGGAGGPDDVRGDAGAVPVHDGGGGVLRGREVSRARRAGPVGRWAGERGGLPRPASSVRSSSVTTVFCPCRPGRRAPSPLLVRLLARAPAHAAGGRAGGGRDRPCSGRRGRPRGGAVRRTRAPARSVRPSSRRARTRPRRVCDSPCQSPVSAEDAQALLEVRDGGGRFAEGEVGVADVAVRGVLHDHGADLVADGERAPVLLDGGAGVGVLVQVAEVAVGHGLAVGVVQLP